MDPISKATHEPYTTDLFLPVIKEAKGNYIAVLSDTSLDRDEENMSKSAIESMQLTGYVAGLIDHDNRVLNQVCEWTNKRVVEIEGHTALIAEPKFFLSNPNAKIIKGMLDEGAQIGISIGAIVNKYEENKVDGIIVRTFTELELLEASFVAVPSNRHGRAIAVAKSYSNKKTKKKMSELKYTEKEFDSKIKEKTKSFEDEVFNLNKKLELNKTEISELKKSVEEKEKAVEDFKKKLETEEKAVEDFKKKLETEKKASLEKQKFANQGGDNIKDKELSEEEKEKAVSKGFLPFKRI